MYGGQTKTNPQGTLAQSIDLRGHKSLQQDLISFLNTIFKNHNTEIAIETGPTPPSKGFN